MNNTIIDGHNRWAIIQKHPELKWSVKQIDFPNKWAAIAWMCRNQLGRRNLTEQMKMKLIQEEHDAIAKSVGAPVGNKNNNKSQFGGKSQIDFGDRNQTRRILADEYGISTHAVRAAVEFGRGLDAAEKASPGIKDAVLSGEVKAPKSVIAEIRNLPEEKQKETAEAIKRGEIEKAKSYIRPIPKQEEPEEPDALTFSPDMEKTLFCVFGTQMANPQPSRCRISPRGGTQIWCSLAHARPAERI